MNLENIKVFFKVYRKRSYFCVDDFFIISISFAEFAVFLYWITINWS